jgi:hypothetical protein
MLGTRPKDLLHGAKATEMQKKPNIFISSKGVLIMSTGEPKGDAVPVIVNHHLKQRMLLVTLLLAAGLLAAQEPAPAPKAQQTAPATSGTTVTREQADEANIQLMREDIRAERKKIVAANMPLTATEATKFWPLYDQYIGETIKINDSRYALIKEYAQNYSGITDAQADSYIKRWVTLDGDNAQLRVKYIPEFEKVISHKKTALFFQIDRRLSMMIELQLASQVPLVKP